MRMKESVYIETTIVSYLTAWPSRDIIRLGDQMVTRDWWDTQRDRSRCTLRNWRFSKRRPVIVRPRMLDSRS